MSSPGVRRVLTRALPARTSPLGGRGFPKVREGRVSDDALVQRLVGLTLWLRHVALGGGEEAAAWARRASAGQSFTHSR